MKSQTTAFLDAADQSLADAQAIMSVKVPRQAARLAYYAQFHAAQAVIFERATKIAKTHKGVNAEFHKIIKTEPAFDPQLAAELTVAYHYKEIADYDTGRISPITTADAADAMLTAQRFVTAIRRILIPVIGG